MCLIDGDMMIADRSLAGNSEETPPRARRRNTKLDAEGEGPQGGTWGDEDGLLRPAARRQRASDSGWDGKQGAKLAGSTRE